MKNKRLFISNKVRGSILSAVFVFLFTISLQAQEITVQGVVTAVEDGFPIPGVTVLVKDTNTGTTTNFDGEYSIVAKKGDILVFSFVGMTPKSIKVEKSQLNISMATDTQSLEEVVVIGYGTVSKKELTGAVSQVKAENIEEFVASDVASMLQGQVAGVNITSASGEPGSESSIQIRGITSLGGSNTPLFVVDGIPQQGDPGLSANEIETIDVLKDAASAAVYGTRGAAGVILITTKKGKVGKTNVSIDANYGVQHLGEDVPLMNTNDRVYFENMRYAYTDWNYEPGPSKNPEWLNNDNKFSDYVLVDNASTQQYSLNVSGGTGDFSYNAVGGFFNQEGVLLNSGYKRYNGRATTSYNVDKWKITSSIAFTIQDTERASNGLIVNAQRYPSYYPEVDPDASEVFTDGTGGVTTPLNILVNSLKRKDNSKSDRLNTSLSVTRKLMDQLKLTSNVGGSTTNYLRNIFVPPYTVTNVLEGTSEVDPTKSYVQATTSRATTFSFDVGLDYKESFGDHTVGAVLNGSVYENSYETFTAYKQGVTNENVEVLNGATINPDAYSGFNYNTKILSFLGRIQYDYKGKYLFSGVIRKDGSSKFGEANRWGTFPSVSLGWNVSDENFWESIKPIVNNFKIRASYGTVGNESFPAYEYSSSIEQGSDYIFDESDNYVNYGSSIKSYANRDVKWETSVQQNLGFDFSFLKNSITLTADYYITNKDDMLFQVELPGSAGAYYDPSITLNVGDMKNTGLEIAAGYQKSFGKHKLQANAVFAMNDNEITSMEGDRNLIYNSNSTLISGDTNSMVTVLAEGYEAGAFWLYETDGVIQTQEQLDAYRKYPSKINADFGDLIYVDHNDDGDITVEDRHYMGSGQSDFEIGFNFKWIYNNFDFTMNWYGSSGAEIMNGTKAATYTYATHGDLVNMWTPENPTSNIPLWTGDSKSGLPNLVATTDYWLEDGDYIRLKLVSIGYTIPKKKLEKLNISNFRIFVLAQNALTFTKYEGYDPEVGGANVARNGMDVSRYPLASLYSLGIKFNF
ncbi:TonB-dependent receptor [Lutibacter sp. A64]|uniref:SusC/RagA family TonB-linked outer membrane protein n=1 Tax=Lutibacter sp. A64 TaxID=2918526 RepID=UPI001F06FD4E|nr:TonB-dependent receptor [Lutibacter sp. A64]UMB54051.1 TonB-dependent receptor [Lutibacter sp. A64]